MDDMRARCSTPDDFLASELIRDPEDMRSLEEMVDDFRSTREAADVSRLAADIDRFLRDEDGGRGAAFGALRTQVHPPAYGRTTAEWLTDIETLLRREASA